MLKKTASLASALMLSVTLVACGGSEASVEAPSEETPVEAAAQSDAMQEEAKVEEVKEAAEPVAATLIGETSPDALRVKVTNDLGVDITGFALRRVGGTEWGTNLLKENEVVKIGASVELGIARDDIATYDLQLADAQGNEAEVTGLALATMTELTLHTEDGAAYATFVDLDGVEGTTKQEEEAQVADDAMDGAAPDELLAPQDEEYYEEPAYEEPAYYEEAAYEEAAYEEAPEQSADDCTRDNIILD